MNEKKEKITEFWKKERKVDDEVNGEREDENEKRQVGKRQQKKGKFIKYKINLNRFRGEGAPLALKLPSMSSSSDLADRHFRHTSAHSANTRGTFGSLLSELHN